MEANLSVKTAEKRERKVLKRSHKRMIFYALMIAIPFLNFLVFYVYQNLSTILLAFQKYSKADSGYNISFAPFENFAAVFKMLNSGKWYMVWNSVVLFFFKTGLGLTLAIIFSFYIYKKCRFSEFFRVMLFLPSVISSVILVLIYGYVVGELYQNVSGAKYGLMLTNPWECIVFFNVWVSFGTNVLMFSGAMSGINDSVVEAAKIDGANVLQEFIHVTLPMIFPTLTTFIIIGLANMFVDQAHIYTFLQESAGQTESVGYFLYVQALRSDVIAKSIPTRKLFYLSYSEISAFGLIITAVIVPIAFLVKWAMEKFGPSED